ncbi:hypothetical protein F5887DRAFT_1001720 [Amanita rubescens]|nr:hypothetical protein F5887DRAFT_1003185 [Amanita rubescens]KAF8330251.1 hypothetical protein F5887DRAFT_1001720 [Amanita rubescens]
MNLIHLLLAIFTTQWWMLPASSITSMRCQHPILILRTTSKSNLRDWNHPKAMPSTALLIPLAGQTSMTMVPSILSSRTGPLITTASRSPTTLHRTCTWESWALNPLIFECTLIQPTIQQSLDSLNLKRF